MAGRLSFNLLQDDVEDNTDLTPAAPPVVVTPEPPAPAPAAESRNVSFGERGNRGWREGGGDAGGRGRRGGRGGRGRGGRGRGMRGRGNRGGFGGSGSGSWDPRGNGERGNSEAPQRKSEDALQQLKPEELVPVELKPENVEETKGEGASDADKEDAPPQPPKEKEMTLDEYMAKKAAMQQEMRSLSTKSARKANDGQVGYGGKMAVLKKKMDGNQEVDETSIMSSVQMKQVVENRSTKDSTHAAVADNAKNQEFFKTPARSSGARSYQSRDSRMNGNGDFRRGGDRQNTGFKGGNRGGRYEGGENRNRGPSYNRGNDDYRGNRDSYNRQRSGAPNMDDQSAFPSLSA